MKQGRIDRFDVKPVTFAEEHGGGEGYLLHIVMDFAKPGAEAQELLEVGASCRVDADCEYMAQLFHDIARELKRLPKQAPVNNQNPTLRVIK